MGSFVVIAFRFLSEEESELITQFTTFFGMLGSSTEDSMATSAGKPLTEPELLCVDHKIMANKVNNDNT